ncbi:RagB/SusD family nutrient uptake outer membrane protein [Labilibacter marinus]|uniref:RagB/SusD family nutrient uptake outer membrane protein n=1 Tax=Labilibacter marinus TaxID=1477105 RepID=UPI00094FB19F|nr:RagB/SusD family nutrient uptake outer membrane protein [Labilibacter marinus]
MKIKYFIGICLSVLIFASCEDYLDKSPEMGLTGDQVYSDYVTFKGTVDRAVGLLHNYVYDPYDYGGEVGTFSDECQLARPTGIGSAILTSINTGNWENYRNAGMRWDMGIGEVATGGSTNDEWAYRHHYREVHAEAAVGIRAVNVALQNMDKLQSFPEGSVYSPEELKAQLKGQCYFLRAWFYFMIIRDYGGMPNMQKAYSSDEDFDVVRPTYQMSSYWATQDLDSAIVYLPQDWSDSPNDIGRATITTAKALKSMVQLYAASPNYNIPLNESLGFSGDAMSKFNTAMADTALNSCIDAIKSAEDPFTRYTMYDATTYLQNFHQRAAEGKGLSNEAIFQPYIRFTGGGNIAGAGMYLPSWDANQGWANFSVPTHNAVDWFETADGWEVGDNWHLGVGDAEDNSTVWSRTDPYANRDPRLKKFIFCHGDNMYNGSRDGNLDNSAINKDRQGLPPVLGADNPNGAHYTYEVNQGWNHTGFYHAGKYRWSGNNNANRTNGYGRIFPFIRMAQLYLDFAELANELYGPQGGVPNNSSSVGNAVDAIDRVRERVGMPKVRPEYYASKEIFREYIRKERARELFYEQHRWWDLKRWRTAHVELAKGIWVADISEANGTYTFGKKQSGYPRVFDNRHYWYPFHTDEMNLFKNFEQNPGW